MFEEWFRRLFNQIHEPERQEPMEMDEVKLEYPKVRITCLRRTVIIYRTLDGLRYEVEECFEEVNGIKSVKLIKDN